MPPEATSLWSFFMEMFENPTHDPLWYWTQYWYHVLHNWVCLSVIVKTVEKLHIFGSDLHGALPKSPWFKQQNGWIRNGHVVPDFSSSEHCLDEPRCLKEKVKGTFRQPSLKRSRKVERGSFCIQVYCFITSCYKFPTVQEGVPLHGIISYWLHSRENKITCWR